MRITNKMLDDRLAVINDMLNRPVGYAKGALVFDMAYGGVALNEMISDGGAERTISGRMTKRELYEYMEGFIKGIQYQRGDYKTNPTRKARAKKVAKKVAKKKAKRAFARKNKYSIWKVVNGETTGLATSNEFSSKDSAQRFCKDHLDKRGSYAIVNSRLTSVGVNKALTGKA